MLPPIIHKEGGKFKMEKSSLQHWGIKGMKWGVRRYQNSDGTLTDAGKRRYAKELAKIEAEKKILRNKARTQAKIDKLNAARQANEEQKEALGLKKPKVEKAPKPAVPKKRSIKDLSDEELQARINRMKLENDYRKLVSDLNPKQTSAGEKFLKEQVVPKATKAITDIATDFATKKAKELLGLNKQNPMESLKKEAEKAEYLTKILKYEDERDRRAEKKKKKDN
jgi:hypothetical protein